MRIVWSWSKECKYSVYTTFILQLYLWLVLWTRVDGSYLSLVVGSHSPPQEVEATPGQKPVHYCTKKRATVAQKK